METEVNELIVIEQQTALQVFTSGEVDPIIKQAKEIVDNFKHDMSTGVSRAKTASLASKVSKFKVKIDGMGKDLVSDWKSKAKAVDDSRKILRDGLDALRDEARKPLTDWENAEKERVEKHQGKIEIIKSLSHDLLVRLNVPIDELFEAMDALKVIFVDSSYEEFEFEATKAHQKSMETVNILIKNKKDDLEKESELERLREKEKEREAKEREAELKEEARVEADRKAQEKVDLAEKDKQDAIDEKIEADKKLKEAAEESIRAEERAKIEKQNAIERAKRDTEQAQADKEEEDREALRKREADRANTGNIRREAKECLMKIVDEATAKKIVLAIDQKKIKNVSIKY